MNLGISRTPFLLFVCMAGSVFAVSCGGGGGTAAPSPPPPPSVSVSVAPTAATPFLGATQQFTATVTNSTNTAVTWSVNGIPGGNATVGTIDATGLFTAPPILLNPVAVTIRATSVADASKSATANATVTSDVSVAVSPGPASVELGAQRQFTGTVNASGNPNRNVNWMVNGVAGGNAAFGTMNAAGLYTAPQILPAPANVTIAAISVADPAKSGNAVTTVTSTFSISVSGPAALNNGATAQFTSVISAAPNSNPNPSVIWSASCSSSSCGVITAGGLYTAPTVVPVNNFPVIISAQSVADPAKSAAANSSIQVLVQVTVSPSPATVALETNQSFTASVTGITNQTVTWDVNGVVGGIQATTGAVSQTGTYFAPVNMPAARQVTLRAVSNGDTTKSASVTVSLISNISITLQPAGSTRAVNHRETFCAAIGNTSNLGLTWAVNGVTNGNLSVGQLLTPATTPCSPLLGPNVSSVDYVAPTSVPGANPVNVTVTSAADSARSASAPVTILPNVQVSLSPSATILPPTGTQQFTTAVAGTSNQQINWALSGPNCSGAACGSITSAGLFTAPGLLASGPVTVTATSADDPTQSASAVASLTIGPIIQKLLPSGVTATTAGNFTLELDGINFVPNSPGPGSAIRFAGNLRVTQCASATICTMTLTSADMSAQGDATVLVENPGAPPVPSNSVIFRVAAAAITEDIIPVNGSTPVTGKDIVVPESPVAAMAGVQSLNIRAIDLVNTTSNSCTLGAPFITLQRPASGQINLDICILGDGVTVSDTFTLSGPGDIGIFNPQNLGTGLVRLTLMLPASAQVGLRTLFVENQNKERTAANGAVRVK